MDTYFIKPQDLLALSIAICGWHFAKVKRLSRSAILEEYSAHQQEEQEVMKLQSQKHRQKMEPDRDPMIHQHAQAGSQKKRKEEHLRS
jgi:hypothetical protein